MPFSLHEWRLQRLGLCNVAAFRLDSHVNQVGIHHKRSTTAMSRAKCQEIVGISNPQSPRGEVVTDSLYADKGCIKKGMLYHYINNDIIVALRFRCPAVYGSANGLNFAKI